MCTDYFEAYRDCKKSWVSIQLSNLLSFYVF